MHDSNPSMGVILPLEEYKPSRMAMESHAQKEFFQKWDVRRVLTGDPGSIKGLHGVNGLNDSR